MPFLRQQRYGPMKKKIVTPRERAHKLPSVEPTGGKGEKKKNFRHDHSSPLGERPKSPRHSRLRVGRGEEGFVATCGRPENSATALIRGKDHLCRKWGGNSASAYPKQKTAAMRSAMKKKKKKEKPSPKACAEQKSGGPLKLYNVGNWRNASAEEGGKKKGKGTHRAVETRTGRWADKRGGTKIRRPTSLGGVGGSVELDRKEGRGTQASSPRDVTAGRALNPSSSKPEKRKKKTSYPGLSRR